MTPNHAFERTAASALACLRPPPRYARRPPLNASVGHHRRASPNEHVEARKKELLQPVLFEAGGGLMDCQGFELGVALLLLHFSRLGTRGLAPEKVYLILEDKEKDRGSAHRDAEEARQGK